MLYSWYQLSHFVHHVRRRRHSFSTAYTWLFFKLLGTGAGAFFAERRGLTILRPFYSDQQIDEYQLITRLERACSSISTAIMPNAYRVVVSIALPPRPYPAPWAHSICVPDAIMITTININNQKQYLRIVTIF